ncbi:MAG: hypothetical protein AB3N19_09320 [Ruegeria sp.]
MSKSNSDSAHQKALKALREELSKIRDYKTVPDVRPSSNNDTKADQEAFAFQSGHYDDIEKQRQRAEIQTIVETNSDLKANRELRWRYATWVFKYLVYYSIAVGGLIVVNAIGDFHIPYWIHAETAAKGPSSFRVFWMNFSFSIPDSTLTTLVGSTAVSAIGLVLAVTHGLFGKK